MQPKEGSVFMHYDLTIHNHWSISTPAVSLSVQGVRWFMNKVQISIRFWLLPRCLLTLPAGFIILSARLITLPARLMTLPARLHQQTSVDRRETGLPSVGTAAATSAIVSMIYEYFDITKIACCSFPQMTKSNCQQRIWHNVFPHPGCALFEPREQSIKCNPLPVDVTVQNKQTKASPSWKLGPRFTLIKY